MVLAAVAALAGGAVSSAAGFGFALVLAPALLGALDPYEAMTTVLLLAVVLNVLNLLQGVGDGQVRWRTVAPALAAAVPGLGLGIAVLEALSKPALQVAVGALVIAAAAMQARAPALRRKRQPSLASAGAVGLASGALATSTGNPGLPLVFWLQAHGFAPDEFRSSLAACFLGLNLAGAAVLLAAGGGDVAAGSTLVLLVALALAGWWLGGRAFRRLDPGRFRALVLTLLLATGAASVAAGLAAS